MRCSRCSWWRCIWPDARFAPTRNQLVNPSDERLASHSELAPPKRTPGSDTFIVPWRSPCHDVFLVVTTPTTSRNRPLRCPSQSAGPELPGSWISWPSRSLTGWIQSTRASRCVPLNAELESEVARLRAGNATPRMKRKILKKRRRSSPGSPSEVRLRRTGTGSLSGSAVVPRAGGIRGRLPRLSASATAGVTGGGQPARSPIRRRQPNRNPPPERLLRVTPMHA